MAKPILPAFLSCQGFHLTDEEKYLFAKSNPLGICLFSRGCNNVQNKQQLKELTTEIKEVIGRDDVLIAVDQEGGRVRRLSGDDFTPLTEQAQLSTVELTKEHAYLTSFDLKSCGINVNFAPVLDIFYPFTSDVLQGRCFSGNAETIAKLGKAMVDEYIKNGVCPCIKHLPGHGRANVDPHLELPMITNNIDEMEADFFPFKQLNYAPMGMVAHLLLSAIDKQNPSSTSGVIINDIIRQKIGFSGLLVTDAIVMHALKGSIIERSEQALKAGADIICLGNAGLVANEELATGKLTMSDEAMERMQAIRQTIKSEPNYNQYQQIKNNYCTSLKNIISYNSDYDATEVLSRIYQ